MLTSHFIGTYTLPLTYTLHFVRHYESPPAGSSCGRSWFPFYVTSFHDYQFFNVFQQVAGELGTLWLTQFNEARSQSGIWSLINSTYLQNFWIEERLQLLNKLSYYVVFLHLTSTQFPLGDNFLGQALQPVTPFRFALHCSHLMFSNTSIFQFVVHFTVLSFSIFHFLRELIFRHCNFPFLQFSVQSTGFQILTLPATSFQCFIQWYFLHLHRDGAELPLNTRDFPTDLLSFFSLSCFWKLLILNIVFKARTKLSRCKCVLTHIISHFLCVLACASRRFSKNGNNAKRAGSERNAKPWC